MFILHASRQAYANQERDATLVSSAVTIQTETLPNVQMSVPSNLKMSLSLAFGGLWGVISVAVRA